MEAPCSAIISRAISIFDLVYLADEHSIGRVPATHNEISHRLEAFHDGMD